MAPSSALERYIWPAFYCSCAGAGFVIIPLLCWHMNAQYGRNERNNNWDPNTGEPRDGPRVDPQRQSPDTWMEYLFGNLFGKKENPPPLPPRRPQPGPPPECPPRPDPAEVPTPEQRQSPPSGVAPDSSTRSHQPPPLPPSPTLPLHNPRNLSTYPCLDVVRQTPLPPSRNLSPISERSSAPSTPSPTLSSKQPSTPPPPPASTLYPEPPWAPRQQERIGLTRIPPQSPTPERPPRPDPANNLSPGQLQSGLTSGSFTCLRQEAPKSSSPKLPPHIPGDWVRDEVRDTLDRHQPIPRPPSRALSTIPEHPSTPTSPYHSPSPSPELPPLPQHQQQDPPTHIPPRTPNVAGENSDSPNRPGTPPPSHTSWQQNSSSPGSPTPGARRANQQRSRERRRRFGGQSRRWNPYPHRINSIDPNNTNAAYWSEEDYSEDEPEEGDDEDIRNEPKRDDDGDEPTTDAPEDEPETDGPEEEPRDAQAGQDEAFQRRPSDARNDPPEMQRTRFR
uniref:Uncharacterized protein n=1 Tax=Colletotrichum fructicola (strain Nara gc5) TaxID=1213859 RepID=L2FFY5_COLFN